MRQWVNTVEIAFQRYERRKLQLAASQPAAGSAAAARMEAATNLEQGSTASASSAPLAASATGVAQRWTASVTTEQEVTLLEANPDPIVLILCQWPLSRRRPSKSTYFVLHLSLRFHPSPCFQPLASLLTVGYGRRVSRPKARVTGGASRLDVCRRSVRQGAPAHLSRPRCSSRHTCNLKRGIGGVAIP